MSKITAKQLHVLIKHHYPNADISIWDNQYETLTYKEARILYSQFQRAMWKIKLRQWVKNKLDCDKWARLFTAHVIVKNAISKRRNARAFGQIAYRINGEPKRGHMINFCVVWTGKRYEIQEIEPQPRKGFTKLKLKEASSAWHVAL